METLKEKLAALLFFIQLKGKIEMNNKIYILLFSIFYGFAESSLMLNCNSTGDKIFFGILSMYHMWLMIIFLVMSLMCKGGWKYIPLMLVIEDISFYLYRLDWPESGDWISSIFGGSYLFGIYIPWAYIIGIFTTLIWLEFFPLNQKRKV